MLDSQTDQSIARYPRSIVTVNGKALQFIDWEVDTTTYFLADKFTVNFPLKGQPLGFDDADWSSEPAIMIEIFVGFPRNINTYSKNDLKKLITGQVDSISIDDDKQMVTVQGRDLTAKFIDNKTTQKYPNLTASQIIEKLAAKEGLTADVTPTSEKAGVFYANDHSTLTSETPEWDLMTYLAEQENYSLYVEGTTVYFHPAPTEKSTPYPIKYSQPTGDQAFISIPGMKLRRQRSLTVARDIIVTVRSWRSGEKRPIVVRVKATPNKKTQLAQAAQPIGDAQTYTYIRPNLTREQALQYAQTMLRLLSRQERIIEIEMPGDNTIKKVDVIKLTGTNTDFDQVYFTSTVTRQFNINDGYLMTVKGKNHSPNSQVLV